MSSTIGKNHPSNHCMWKYQFVCKKLNRFQKTDSFGIDSFGIDSTFEVSKGKVFTRDDFASINLLTDSTFLKNACVTVYFYDRLFTCLLSPTAFCFLAGILNSLIWEISLHFSHGTSHISWDENRAIQQHYLSFVSVWKFLNGKLERASTGPAFLSPLFSIQDDSADHLCSRKWTQVKLSGLRPVTQRWSPSLNAWPFSVKVEHHEFSKQLSLFESQKLLEHFLSDHVVRRLSRFLAFWKFWCFFGLSSQTLNRF